MTVVGKSKKEVVYIHNIEPSNRSEREKKHIYKLVNCDTNSRVHVMLVVSNRFVVYTNIFLKLIHKIKGMHGTIQIR